MVTEYTWVLLNLLRFVLWPKVWSILVNVLWTHERKYILLLGGVFCKCQVDLVDSVIQILYIVIDFLSVLSVIGRRVLKSVTVDLSIICNSISLYYIIWKSVIRCINISDCLSCIDLFYHDEIIFVPGYILFALKFTFVR